LKHERHLRLLINDEEIQGNQVKLNERVVARAVRVIGGSVLMVLAATGEIGGWGWLGVIPLITGAVGAIGVCSISSCFGSGTCSIKK